MWPWPLISGLDLSGNLSSLGQTQQHSVHICLLQTTLAGFFYGYNRLKVLIPNISHPEVLVRRHQLTVLPWFPDLWDFSTPEGDAEVHLNWFRYSVIRCFVVLQLFSVFFSQVFFFNLQTELLLVLERTSSIIFFAAVRNFQPLLGPKACPTSSLCQMWVEGIPCDWVTGESVCVCVRVCLCVCVTGD